MNEQGAPIVLSMEQDGDAFSGHGTINGRPVAMAGPLRWTAIGALTHPNGAVTSHSLVLEPDGQTLRLETPGREPVLLARTGPPDPGQPGPFSGTYVGTGPAGPFVQATLLQQGPLISGTAVVLGEPVGLGARVTEPGHADGVATFADESHAGFRLELDDDGDSLLLLGVGGPVTLQRAGR